MKNRLPPDFPADWEPPQHLDALVDDFMADLPIDLPRRGEARRRLRRMRAEIALGAVKEYASSRSAS